MGTAGDVNGDGYPDLLVSARNARSTGRVHVYLGGPTLGTVPALTLGPPSSTPITGFGVAAGPAGDVNGDGLADRGLRGRLQRQLAQPGR